MNVQQLIDMLQSIQNKDTEVWVAKDAEGNAFHPLQMVDIVTSDYLDLEDDDWDPNRLHVVLWP